MELTAEKGWFSRSVVSCFVLLAVASCARVAQTGTSQSLVASGNAPQSVAELKGSSSRILANDPLPLELVEGRNFNQLVIKSDVASEGITSERLENPARFVIDLPISSGQLSKKVFETADAEFVSRVRVGSHPDKTRIVIDLPENQSSISPSVESRDGSIVVTLLSTDIALDSTRAMPIVAEGTTTASSTTASSKSLSNTGATLAPVAQKSVTIPVTLRPSLNGVRLEQLSENQNSLLIDMESAGVYSLQRTAPSEYVLTLENAALNPAAPTSLVAQPNSGKIRSVRSMVQGDDVVLRIFSSPDVALSAQSRSGGISVTAMSHAEAALVNAASMRGQLAPEKAAAATSAATETKSDATAAVTETAAPAGESEKVDFGALLADQEYTGRLISLDLQDTDIDNALRIIAEVSNLNIVTTDDVQGKVTLRLIDVPWDQALDVILKINALGKVQEGNVVRIAPLEKLRAERESLKQAKQAEEQLEELKVRYIRVSYARAADMKPLVETVVSERGNVAYDERTNQLVVKDTKIGLQRVLELVRKLDLRTPQVLLETQIVESKRNFGRQLGASASYRSVQSPSTGNATGWNFPNSIDAGGESNNLGSLGESSAGLLGFVLGSADGTKSLELTLAAAENEGIARVVSRPSVATTNNKQAVIKSVEKVRVKTPSGGSSVNVGQGNSGTSNAVATETIEAGIILEVTPQASPDYYVLMDVNAKSSSFGTQTVEGIPNEIERSATSSILVSSGQTFVMGGIYKITDNQDLNGIPFLKDVPVFGHLFRNSDVRDTDEELLFFITPRIIEGSFDDAAMKASM